jgi:hypothetical protein
VNAETKALRAMLDDDPQTAQNALADATPTELAEVRDAAAGLSEVCGEMLETLRAEGRRG